MAESNSKFTTVVLGGVALLVAVASWIQPINSFFYRTTFLLGLAGSLLALLVLIRKTYLRLLLLLGVAYVAYGFMKGEVSSMDRAVFDDVWTQTTLGYQGTPYRFGGESLMGMDSGGLLRRSLVVSHLRLAMSTGNPYYFKVAYNIWRAPFSLASLLHPNNTWVEFIGYYTPDRSVEMRPGDILISRSRTDMAVYVGQGEVVGLSTPLKEVVVRPLGSGEMSVFGSWAFVVRWQPWNFGSELLPPT